MKILEAKIEFENGIRIKRVAVLSDYSDDDKPFCDVRAMEALSKPKFMAGYMALSHPLESIDVDLIKRVADYGMDVDVNKEFPGWEKRHKA